MVKLEDFQMSVQKHLQRLWKALNGKGNNKELDEALIQQGESEEERRLIAEQCAEIDLEHDLMEELIASKEDPGEWLEKKIEETVRETIPNATQEEIEMVKDCVADSIEKEIGEQADGLTEEATMICTAMGEEDIKGGKQL